LDVRHKDIRIEFVPKQQMRYSTAGDWFLSGNGLTIQVSDEVSEQEQFLIALHELIEWRLCASRGITQSMVDSFDFAFHGEGEPGDSEFAPYRREHRFASLIEFMMAHEMCLNGYGRIE